MVALVVDSVTALTVSVLVSLGMLRVEIRTETELDTVVVKEVVAAQVLIVVVSVHNTTCFILVTFGLDVAAEEELEAAEGLEAQRGLSSAIVSAIPSP